MGLCCLMTLVKPGSEQGLRTGRDDAELGRSRDQYDHGEQRRVVHESENQHCVRQWRTSNETSQEVGTNHCAFL